MKTRISKIVCLLALSSVFQAKAQNTIQGTITNEEGKSLPEVKIGILKTYSGTFSDENGKYQLNNILQDTVQLRISLIGYEDEEVLVIFNNNVIEKNIVLNSSARMIEEVQISAVRADNSTPTTFTNLSKEEIQKGNFGQDIPYLMEKTPSTVVTSDAGAGVGYTGIRIRGVDPTRTNVTINGIPLNDAESHGVYWVNMPDFASSTDNIQIQRGVGTSTNGAAAFGSSINIKTDNIQKDATTSVDNSFGSFNTIKNNIKVGTGIINNKFSFDARVSRIQSDGYVDRASSNLNSMYLSGAWIGKKTLIKANLFRGHERTYQAWWGVNDEQLKNNRTFNYYTYENEVDNYNQDHYQLHLTQTINSKMNFNISGHYTKGYGYYEQYKNNEDFSTYGFSPIILSKDTINTSDIIRRRWLDNDFYGTVFSFNYTNLKNLKLVWGGSINEYKGKHFGEVIWVRSASQSEIGDRYYENDAKKNEISSYLRGNYKIKKINAYLDLQVRNINYSYLGFDESFGNLVELQQNISFTFFNPKAGLSYTINDKSNLYASYAVANREPVRTDFINSSPQSRPKAENLQNLEVGYKYQHKKFFSNLNYYLMNYNDQLILSGEINDVGAYNRINVDKSYRMGVELEFGYMINKKLSVSGNLMLSSNKIKEFNEYIDNYDNYDIDGNMIQDVINHKNTDIAFSPNAIASLGLLYEPIKNLELGLMSKYVGKQYLDNTSNNNRKLNEYYLTNLTLNYTFVKLGLKEIKVGVLVNNVFNYLYENNGYTFSYVYGGELTTENYYYPQAGRNFLARISFNF
jgi:iron complex outermembrane recepter protein